MNPRSLCLAGVLGLGLTNTVLPEAAAQVVCIPSDTVALDPSIWNASRGVFFGHALGQTFFAPETLISRLTVWRPPDNRSVVGAHLYITGVDTVWSPPRPDNDNLLLDGPTVRVYDSDPPGQLIEMSFTLDPPLALPRPGLYAFFLQAEACHQGAVWNLIGNDTNPYPYGIYWISGRVTQPPCHLRGVAAGEDILDLIFRIEFCRPDVATPVRRSTWGQIKALYR